MVGTEECQGVQVLPLFDGLVPVHLLVGNLHQIVYQIIVVLIADVISDGIADGQDGSAVVLADHLL